MFQATHLIGFGAGGSLIDELCQDMPQGTGTAIGDMTGNGGLAAAFDTTYDTSSGTSANKGATTDAYIGKDWGSGNSTIICGFDIYPPDTYSGKFFRGSTDGQIRLYASNSSPSNATDGTLCFDSGVISTTSYGSSTPYSVTESSITNFLEARYHWITLTDTVSHDIYVGELEFDAKRVVF